MSLELCVSRLKELPRSTWGICRVTCFLNDSPSILGHFIGTWLYIINFTTSFVYSVYTWTAKGEEWKINNYRLCQLFHITHQCLSSLTVFASPLYDSIGEQFLYFLKYKVFQQKVAPTLSWKVSMFRKIPKTGQIWF